MGQDSEPVRNRTSQNVVPPLVSVEALNGARFAKDAACPGNGGAISVSQLSGNMLLYATY